MTSLGVILILVGLLMARSGFAAAWRMKNYFELKARGLPVDGEYGYHVLFRKLWWIPLGIGIFLVIFS